MPLSRGPGYPRYTVACSYPYCSNRTGPPVTVAHWRANAQ